MLVGEKGRSRLRASGVGGHLGGWGWESRRLLGVRGGDGLNVQREDCQRAAGKDLDFRYCDTPEYEKLPPYRQKVFLGVQKCSWLQPCEHWKTRAGQHILSAT